MAMRISLTAVLLLPGLTLLPAAWASDLGDLQTRFEKDRSALVEDYGTRLGDRTAQHLTDLRKLQQKRSTQGDTEGAALVAKEIERLATEHAVWKQLSSTALQIAASSALNRPQNQPPGNPHTLVSQTTDNTSGAHAPALRPPRSPPLPPKVTDTSTSTTNSATPTPSPGSSAGIATIHHLAVGARVVASSTHLGETGENEPHALTDGNIFTRWSSGYTEPQEVTLFLDGPRKLKTLRLHWEKACATKYCVYLSMDGKEWRSVYLYMNIGQPPEARVDEIDLKNAVASVLRLDLQKCVNQEWGFSLYEIEIQGAE
jgi:hypothetical protein